MSTIRTAIQIQDGMSPAFKAMYNAMNLVLNTFESIQSASNKTIDTTSIQAAREELAKANVIASEFQNQLSNLNSTPVDVPVNPTKIQNNAENKVPEWQPSPNMQVFTNTGIERYQQEINSANNMINQLSQSQQKLQQQAQKMNLLPNNAINDINSLNTRIERIKTTLQEVQAKKITGIGADKASSQVESLRQELNEAIQSQNELTQAMDRMDITATNEAYQKLVNNIDSAERNIRENITGQEQFNNSINLGVHSADNLSNKFKSILATILSIVGAKKVLDLADETSLTSSRLNLIVDDGGSVKDLENKIFASATRTRAEYLDTANVISKLGILAGDSFKNTDEIIAFTELMNKNFKISGASIQEQTAGMYQLTQAMASGKLQGDEFRSIMENAPLLAEAISDYTGKSKGQLKELSSEGKITADVIKNAMFAAADKTEQRFQQMPMTFAEAWTKMKNIAIKTFQPVLTKISSVVNSSEFQEMFSSFIDVISIAAQAVLELINAVTWLYGVLEPYAPLILGIVGAYVAFTAISGLVSIALGIMSAMETIHAAASMMAAGATFAETAAQWGLNSALLACPIVWIVILILALIVALTYLWFTNDKVAKAILFLWDSLKLGIMAAGLGIQAAWYGLQLAAMYLWLGIQTVVLGLMTAWYGFQTGVEAVCLGVLSIFQGLYNGIVSIVNAIIGVLNKIPGVNIDYAETAHFADDFASNMSKNLIDRNKKLQDMASQMDGTMDKINSMKSDFSAKLSAGATSIQNTASQMNATRDERVANRNNWAKGASSAIKDALNMDGFDFGNMGSNLGNKLGDIKGDTGKISNSMDITEDDLKYLRDLAEQEVINRFTTAEIKIDMTNNNNINNEADLDGIVEYLEDKLYETMEIAAEGVHD